jgi:hypothetical protein
MPGYKSYRTCKVIENPTIISRTSKFLPIKGIVLPAARKALLCVASPYIFSINKKNAEKLGQKKLACVSLWRKICYVS